MRNFFFTYMKTRKCWDQHLMEATEKAWKRLYIYMKRGWEPGKFIKNK